MTLKPITMALALSFLMIVSSSGFAAEPNLMQVSSPAFESNGMIPQEFTCQGKDINPPLEINFIPKKTKSLVLIHDDPDATTGTWDHWVMFGIPAPPVNKLVIETASAPGVQGKNSWGRNDYGGPCPPSGTHRYFYKIYALDTELNLPAGSTKKEVEMAMQGHLLEKAELIGLYRKS